MADDHDPHPNTPPEAAAIHSAGHSGGAPRFKRLVVIGAGLLGASVALAARKHALVDRIAGLGRSQATLDKALQLGVVDEASRDDAILDGADLVVVATPLSAFEAALTAVAKFAPPTALVTDVGSTKANVVDMAQRILAGRQPFVGAHPMAGSEKSGPEHATADLFLGRPCVLTPAPDTSPDALAAAHAFWQALGFAAVLEMSPEDHDRAVAAVSHLPHLASVMLVEAAQHLGGWELASTGFRDTTRLAASNPPMRADIIDANRPAIAQALRAYRDRVDAWIAAVEQDDHAARLRLLEAAKQTRQDALAPGTSTP
ncbi:MAG: prephenate dehydrogenase [Planctomycetota bacterium]